MGTRLVRYLGLHDGAPDPITLEVDGEVVSVARGEAIEVEAREARALLTEPGAADDSGSDWAPVPRGTP